MSASCSASRGSPRPSSGGFGSFPGAIVGGVALGLLESLGAAYVSSAWKDSIAFVVLLLVLFVRPHGLLGKAVRP